MKTAASFLVFLLLASTALARPPVEVTPETPQEKITNQLNQTIIAKFNVKDLSLQDAVAEIVKDARETDPKSTPVPIVLDLEQPTNATITLNLSNIPEAELLRYLTELGKPPLRCLVSGEGVTITDKQGPVVFPNPASTSPPAPPDRAPDGDLLLTRQYFVPEDFFIGKVVSDAKCQEMLEKEGVAFPYGASATFDESGALALYDTGLLTVRTTLENQKKTEALLDKGYKEADREADKVTQQLKKTILPKIDFKNDTLADVIAAITKAAKAAAPDLTPVPMAIDRSAMFTAGPADPAANAPPPLVKKDIRVTLHLVKVSELDLLRMIGAVAVYSHISKNGVLFYDRGEEGPQRLLTWEYPASAKLTDDEYRDALTKSGIHFESGSSVHYDATKKILTVRALDISLDLIDPIAAALKDAPPKPNPPKTR